MYKAFVIGLGRIAFTMEQDSFRTFPCTHAGAYFDHQEVDLIGGYDIDQNQCDLFEESYTGVKTASKNLKNILQELKPNIISICASSSAHLESCQIVAEYAKSNQVFGVLLEKPVGMDTKEAIEIQELLKGLNVVVCHDRRFYSSFSFYKSLINKRGLGKLKSIHGEIHCGSFVKKSKGQKEKSYFGGPLLHDGTHLFDLMVWYAGRPLSVNGVASQEKKNLLTEDTCLGNMFFENNVLGSFLVGGRRRYFHFEIQIQWERAKLIDSHGNISFFQKPSNSPFLKPKQLELPTAINPFKSRLKHLLDIIESKAPNQSTIQDGLDAVKVIDCIYNSCQNKGTLVHLDNGNTPSNLMVLDRS
ncbi:MAG: Gfo/Idh/MocA family oxidoreductase [Candidatus Cloacimonetes bacterium]|nr:Gfo/Idh/MocA family oxidoreductase [Candidatus Cloacimonadota bacterium]